MLIMVEEKLILKCRGILLVMMLGKWLTDVGELP